MKGKEPTRKELLKWIQDVLVTRFDGKQSEMARGTGINASQISDYIRDVRPLSLPMVYRIVREAHVDPPNGVVVPVLVKKMGGVKDESLDDLVETVRGLAAQMTRMEGKLDKLQKDLSAILKRG